MLLRRLLAGLAALVLLAGLAFPTQGQDVKKDDKKDEKKDDKKKDDKKPEEKKDDKAKANLVWKLEPTAEKKVAFYQKMTTKTDQKFAVMGNVVSQNQSQIFWFSWTPEKKDGDNIVLKQKIEGVQMIIDIGNQKVAYDSTAKTNDNNPLNDFFKALIGAEFTVTLDKNYKVVKIDGYKEFVEKLAKANPTMKNLLETILTEQSLKQMVEPTFAVLPNKEVSEGAEWNLEGKLDMGPIGTYTNNYKYKYVGKDPANKALDKIDVAVSLTYKAPDANAQVATLPFKIKSADLTSKDAKGVVLYNPEKGYVESSEMTLKLEGTLNIEIGGATTEVKIDQTQVSKVETTPGDKKPPELEKKP